ncbi:MAG: Holliday junction resolvase-like protein [Candidatus Aenigmatarchaeota archaeon]
MFELVLFVLLSIAIGIAAVYRYLYLRKCTAHSEVLSSKQSLSTKYGKMSEQFFPFMKDYPYDTSMFRFLGTPIDGVQFSDDRIVFVEFKTSSSKLSERQKHIKELVDNKKVEFKEFRI